MILQYPSPGQEVPIYWTGVKHELAQKRSLEMEPNNEKTTLMEANDECSIYIPHEPASATGKENSWYDSAIAVQ